MLKRFLASAAIGLSVLGATAASAHTWNYNHHGLRHQPAGAVAIAPAATPTIYPAARKFLAYPYNLHETDGLSRNPNDCAVYGCIDNN